MAVDDTVNVRYMVHDVPKRSTSTRPTSASSHGARCFPPSPTSPEGTSVCLLSGPTSSAGRPMPDGALPGPGGWNRVHFVTSDLDGEIARLEAAGVRFRNDVVSGPGGRQVLAEDPSGNLIELYQPADR